MPKLIINNVYSFILDIPEHIAKDLNKQLRFPIKNRHWNPLVARKQWDGFVEFFKEKTGRFLTGLLPEVQFAIKSYGLDLQIEDCRNFVEFNVSDIKSNFLENGIILRDYQMDYVEKLIKHQRGVIPAPPGAGKTAMMTCLIKAMKEKTPTLVLANRISLINQNYKELVSCGIPNVGRFYGKIKKPDWITCSTIQSCEKLAPIFPKIKAIIVDEIHDMMTKECKLVYSRCPNASLRVGMSGTPFKDGGEDLIQKYEVKGHIGPLLKTKFSKSNGFITTKELENRDILSKSNCTFFTIDKPELKYILYNEAVSLGIAENDYLNSIILKLIKSIKGRTLILVERIKQGDILAKLIGGDISWVSGRDDEQSREIVIDKLKNSENCVAIASRGIFNTGVSFFCHNLINAAGGSAEHLIEQRFGRGLRVSSDKEILNYYDFYFKNNEYLLSHSKKRVKILKKQGYDVEIKEFENYM